jgi:glycosyltransferase involved in cell wall biosynthesis
VTEPGTVPAAAPAGDSAAHADAPAPTANAAASAPAAAPRFAIVVPAWNEEAVIAQTVGQLRAIADNLGLPYELVVADDGSTDRTAELARAAGARVVPVAHRQIAAVRNAGARATVAPWLVFVDADTWVPETVLRHALLELASGAVGGGSRVAFDGRGHPVAEAFFEGFKALWYSQELAAGCFLFARRDAFEAVGGFDEQWFAGEEYWMSRALKERGRFAFLREEVVSSARKQRAGAGIGMLARLLGLTVLFFVGWRRPLRSREALGFWYDGTREGKPVDLG